MVRRDLNSTRLGQGVDAVRMLDPAAIERTIECLREFKALAQRLGVEWYRAVATSAVREAANRQEFVDRVDRECGLAVDVIAGEQEALLSYRGVECGLHLSHPPLVVDLGGGSCEFILRDGKKQMALSLPLGAVRATEAEYGSDDIQDILSPLLPFRQKYEEYPLVFVGGTATTLAALRLALTEYDPSLIHGQALSFTDIEGIYRQLVSLPLSLRKNLPGLQPERADIIPAGALIVLEIMKGLGRSQVIVSETDILDGIITEAV